jgi:hypothetical protein
MGQLDRSPKDHQKEAQNGKNALRRLESTGIAPLLNHDTGTIAHFAATSERRAFHLSKVAAGFGGH